MSDTQLIAKCPFCGAEVPHAIPDRCGYAAWLCDCGGVACGAWAGDVDEAADQLLWLLKIDGRASEPAVPVGNSGLLSATPYDANKVLTTTPSLLERHGFDAAVTNLKFSQHGHEIELHLIWARPTSQ